MIDYTYWQDQARSRLKKGSVTYRPLKLGTAANFYVGVQMTRETDEEALREILRQFGAKEDRSVRWLFQEQGEIILSKSLNLLDENELMLLGLTGGAKEVYFDEHDLAYLICSVSKLEEIGAILEMEGVEVSFALQSYRPQGLVEVYDKTTARLLFDFCEQLVNEPFVVDICADFGIGEFWIEEFEREKEKYPIKGL